MIEDLLSSDDVRLISELGFAASGRQWIGLALDIFNGLEKIRADRSFVYIGKAMAYINNKQADLAIKVLEAAPVQGQEKGEVDAFLGLAYQLAGHTAKSVTTLSKVVQSDQQVYGKQMALALLGLPDVIHAQKSESKKTTKVAEKK